MLVGGFRCLYRHVIQTLASVVLFIFVSDTYLKLEKWQLILSLFMGALVASVLLCSNFFSTTALIFCNDTYARVYWKISIKVY
jgi:hypothetical protein